MNNKAELIYVHDPMCSWCWGYAPTWSKLKSLLNDDVNIVYKVGGLAPDSDSPMPLQMQTMLQNTWRNIESKLGTEFNFDFWRLCKPKRSTYPSCRAAIIARDANKESVMVAAIQQAYYLEAKNPSDEDVLCQLAQQVDLCTAEEFKLQLNSVLVNDKLLSELDYIRSLPIQGFPSLVLKYNNRLHPIAINYTDADTTYSQINKVLESL
ncbi:DsbA family protein [Pseudoalteromonas sp. A601]|uniref:DsbA family protein n=1 Tax=Pseudoalteromonas sp. A601 TaxID=1967839 RepID=UPI000B3C2D5D|nr:DsbA family protein [Pseudoalteromonas sp. A601]OUS73460.1 DsbA family protein [Pseudoalteromonas sp. A601]